MKNIWNIFRADWRRLTASVVAVVVLLGLCLVPCLYAWFNILSNWDPYGTASTSRISVAVASEDAGCEVLGLDRHQLEQCRKKRMIRARTVNGQMLYDAYELLALTELFYRRKLRKTLSRIPQFTVR